MAEVDKDGLQVGDDSIETDEKGDKTPGKKNEDMLSDIPSEDDDGISDKEDDEKDKDEKDDKKSDRSAIVQKGKYREKLQRARERIAQLEADKAKSDKRIQDKGEIDEKELAAQRLIKKLATEAFEEIEGIRKEEQQRIVDEFDEEVDSVLETHGGEISEDELLDLIEEYSDLGIAVKPEAAAKLILKQRESGTKKPKPKLPSSKRGSPDSEKSSKKEGDQKKSLFEIAQEVKKELKEKFGVGR